MISVIIPTYNRATMVCDCVASVLATNAPVMIFDEPEAGIDLWSFTNLINVFQEMRENLKGTLLVISHQERILRIADEIAIVAGGKIEASGPAADILPRLLYQHTSMESCVKQEAIFE